LILGKGIAANEPTRPPTIVAEGIIGEQAVHCKPTGYQSEADQQPLPDSVK
jgi:hypothetical protein